MADQPARGEMQTSRSKRDRAEISQIYNSSCSGTEELDAEMEELYDDPGPRVKRHKAIAIGAATADRKWSSTVIEAIKGDGKEIPDMVKLWVEKYEKTPKSAMAELLTVLFEACGPKYHLDEDNMDDTVVDDVISALVNMAKEGDIEDYESSERGFKNFKDNLVCFWDNLVSECQDGPLYDRLLFDKCLDYIIALSSTPPRVYRQIASLMGLQLLTSFINVANMLGTQRETTQTQLNAERKNNVEGPCVETLMQRLSVAHEKITAVEELMQKSYSGLFVNRREDVDPIIRMSCIESLGVWVLSYPSLFFQESNLKYLLSALDDNSAGVKKASILALKNIYEVHNNVPPLNNFTDEFYKWMIALANGVDIPVAVCAIGLVNQLLRYQRVPEEELSSLYDLLICGLADIRHAIGEVVHDHLIAMKFQHSQSQSSGRESDSTEVHIRRMLQILKNISTHPIQHSYVIDSVWYHMGAMQDWKCITRMLLQDNSLAELDDVDSTNLCRLLSASVKKSVGESIVPATHSRIPYQSKYEKGTFKINKHNITVLMLKIYPQLLRKFMCDKYKVAPLVEIINNTDLDVYSLNRQEQNFKDVLQLIQEAFFKHSEKDALRSCVKAVKFCASESRGKLQELAKNQVNGLQDELINKLTSAMNDVMHGEDEYSLLVNLKRLYELQLLHEVPLESLYQTFVHIIERFRNIDDEVAAFLLLSMFLHISWCLRSILHCETVDEESLISLLWKRDALLRQLDDLLLNPFQSKSSLAYRVSIITAELWHLLKKTKFTSTKLEMLGYSPEKPTVEKYWKMCEQLLIDNGEGEDENGEYIEEKNADAVMFGVAKLVATDSVPKEYLVPDIICHLRMCSASVKKIVRHLLTTLKKNGDISNLLLEALKRVIVKRTLTCRPIYFMHSRVTLGGVRQSLLFNLNLLWM